MTTELLSQPLTSSFIASKLQGVFLDQQTFHHDVSLLSIKEHVSSLTCYQTTASDEIVERCVHAEIIITNKVIINEETLAQLPKLKLICIAATGTNNVDLTAAKKYGVAVTNVSGYAQHSVAQYVFSQILAHYSNTEHHNQNTARGLWQQSATFCMHGDGMQELANKKMGIIGYGNLGQAVAKLAKAFDMQVLIAERPNAHVRQNRYSFDYVIKNADIISLHCPQTPDTENLFNATTFKKMKSSSLLINTARGAIVNSKDLLHALNSNEITCAVLDVLEQEPPPENHPLLAALLKDDRLKQKLKITAHIAWASIEAQQRLLDLLAKNIAAFNENISINRVN